MGFYVGYLAYLALTNREVRSNQTESWSISPLTYRVGDLIQVNLVSKKHDVD